MTQADRVGFVCRGNVCRSVFAEHLMHRRYPEVEVASAGVHVDVSAPPPLQAVEAGRATSEMRLHGVGVGAASQAGTRSL